MGDIILVIINLAVTIGLIYAIFDMRKNIEIIKNEIEKREK